jgi:hypothetical protein
MPQTTTLTAAEEEITLPWPLEVCLYLDTIVSLLASIDHHLARLNGEEEEEYDEELAPDETSDEAWAEGARFPLSSDLLAETADSGLSRTA